MLFRALLAAVALSCTFSRVTVHANDQGTPRALKDLVCVLFLSGIQKDDLEVSLLKKLEHYNVDIDSLDEKALLLECRNTTNSKPKEENDHKNKSEIIKSKLDSVEIETDTTTIVKAHDDAENAQIKEEPNMFTKLWEKYKKLSTENKDEDFKNKAFFDFVKIIRDTKRQFGYTKSNEDISTIKNILAQHIPEKQSKADHTSYEFDLTTTTTDNILIKNLFNKNQVMEEKLASNVAAINALTQNIINIQKNLKDRKSKANNYSPKPSTYDLASLYKVIENISKAPENLKHGLSSRTKSEEMENFSQDIKRLKYETVPQSIVTERVESKTKNVGHAKPISSDIINQIAESVKLIVLKDLQKEIPIKGKLVTTRAFSIDTTSLPTSRVAINSEDSAITRHMDVNKMQVATQAIEKFLEIFDRLKSTPLEMLKPREQKKSDVHTLKAVQVPMVIYPPPLPPINPYGIKLDQPRANPFVNQMPYVNPYGPLQMTNSDTRNSQPLEVARLTGSVNHIKPQLRNTNPKSKPIMIQTNIDEIKPLPIVIKESPPFNLNIFITTQTPYWDKEQNDRWNYMDRYGRNPDNQQDIIHTKETMNVYSNKETETGSKSVNVGPDIIIDSKYTKKNFPSRENPKLVTTSIEGNKQLYRKNANNEQSQALNSNNNVNTSFHKIDKMGKPTTNEHVKQYDKQSAKQLSQNLHNIKVDMKYEDPSYTGNLFDSPNRVKTTRTDTANNPSLSNKHENIDNKFQSHIAPLKTASHSRTLPNIFVFTNDPSESLNDSRNVNLDSKINTKSLNDMNKFLDTETNDKPSQVSLLLSTSKEKQFENEYIKHVFKNEFENIESPLTHIEFIREKFENTNKHFGPSEEEPRYEYRYKVKPIWHKEGSRSTNLDNIYRDSNIREFYRSWSQEKDLGYRDHGRAKTNLDIEGEELYHKHRPYRPESNYEYSKSAEARHYPSYKRDFAKYSRHHLNTNVQGFQDRWEGNKHLPQSLNECGPDEHCILKVLARHQTPIVGAKSKKYDDKNFKQFLRTQQKVNRMLERILATKTDTYAAQIA